MQAAEWGHEKGSKELVRLRRIDFTNHGRPQNHSNPHQHLLENNSTGGSRKYSKTPTSVTDITEDYLINLYKKSKANYPIGGMENYVTIPKKKTTKTSNQKISTLNSTHEPVKKSNNKFIEKSTSQPGGKSNGKSNEKSNGKSNEKSNGKSGGKK